MTALPIDYRKKPWREKYLTDETDMLKSWIIFGEYLDGTVDISSDNQDIFVRVPRPIAEKIIAARNVFLAEIVEHFGYPGA